MDTDRVNEIIRENLDLDRNEPLKDVLYDCFRQTIVLGKLPAGTQINEERLSKSLHISRTPIRIALDRLNGERLVNRVPGSGVIILGISLRDAEEMYEIRRALEPLAFVKAAHNMQESDFEGMRLLLEEGEQKNAAGDIDGVVGNIGDFNALVFDHARMARLRDILDGIAVYLRYFRNTAIRQGERRDVALKEHWNIYLAMRFGTDEKISDEVQKHLLNNYRYVTKSMRNLGIS